VFTFRDAISKMDGADLLIGVIKVFTSRTYAVLTDNRMAFTDLPETPTNPFAPFWIRTSLAGLAMKTASPTS
jgi:hypothetical protein